MNTISKTLMPFMLLLLVAMPAGASASMKDAWLKLIKAELPPNCAVSITKVGTVVSGNNGSRDEQWFVNTCSGNREYWVYFYPPSAFPDRHSPYAIVRVITKSA